MTVAQCVEGTIRSLIEEGIKGFVIYPYGPVGYLVKRVLEKRFGIEPLCVIDNYQSGLRPFIKKVEYLDRISCDRTAVLIGTHNPSVCKQVAETLKPYEKRMKIVDMFPLQIGKHSWGTLCEKNGYLIERIGAFCSFAEGVNVVSNHAVDSVSTSALFNGIDLDHQPVFEMISDTLPVEALLDNPRCVIGHDVWMGRNVTVCNGARIGDGVIAAAGAVITKDIPAYAVVGGVPARVIKYRYGENQIRMLEEIRWWDWPDEKIAENYRDFYDIDVFLKKHYGQDRG